MRHSELTTLITDPAEIDLYEAMKYDRMRNNGQIRAYLPQPYHGYVYVPLTRTRQRYGWRLWFQAPCCSRRTNKLYVYGRRIGCRHCLELKYPSQYRKDAFSKSLMIDLKLKRLRKQKRRLWYGDYPTQFGVRRDQLIAESNRHYSSIARGMWQRRLSLNI